MPSIKLGDTGKTYRARVVVCEPSDHSLPHEPRDVTIGLSLTDGAAASFPAWVTLSKNEALQLIADLAKGLKSYGTPKPKPLTGVRRTSVGNQ